MPSADAPVNGNFGPIDQPLPGDAPAQMPAFAQDLEMVLNIAFSEVFAGFERMEARAIDGSTLWREKHEDTGELGAPVPAENLPSVKNTQFALCEWLDMLCDNLNQTAEPGRQFLWSVQRTSRVNPEGRNMFVAAVMLLTEGAPLPVPVGKGACDDPAVAIASAMLQAHGYGPAELATLHRELFPHRYLVT